MPSKTIITLDEDNYEETISGNVFLDFSATWCGPCKRMKPEFVKVNDYINTNSIDLTCAVVDVDDMEFLAEEYKINSMPTLILLIDGVEVERTSGFKDYDELKNIVDKHFKKENTNNVITRD
jgi:thioredoxin 1